MKPCLVIMAAGMGSRFGGMKQITPVDPEGHIIMDFSIYDAVKAGFEKVVIVIKEENEAMFRSVIGDRIAKHVQVEYAYQALDALPEGFSVPEGRVKPWGTGHAVLCAADKVSGPFAVINADDFYGRSAFRKIYDFLSNSNDPDGHAMAGYLMKNTLTENGSVARGICEVDENGLLTGVTERTQIEKRPYGAAFTEDGVNYTDISADTIVSMNFWGFGSNMMARLKEGFGPFLASGLAQNPMKCEYFLPMVVGDQIAAGIGSVQVLPVEDRWHGVTYKEDLQGVLSAIEDMKSSGLYPRKLWE